MKTFFALRAFFPSKKAEIGLWTFQSLISLFAQFSDFISQKLFPQRGRKVSEPADRTHTNTEPVSSEPKENIYETPFQHGGKWFPPAPALRLLVLLIAALSQPDLLVTGETAGREWAQIVLMRGQSCNLTHTHTHWINAHTHSKAMFKPNEAWPEKLDPCTHTQMWGVCVWMEVSLVATGRTWCTAFHCAALWLTCVHPAAEWSSEESVPDGPHQPGKRFTHCLEMFSPSRP